MPEETHLDTAIPLIGWQDADREPDLPNQQGRRPKKKTRKPPADEPASTRKPAPGDGKGTHIDVTV